MCFSGNSTPAELLRKWSAVYVLPRWTHLDERELVRVRVRNVGGEAWESRCVKYFSRLLESAGPLIVKVLVGGEHRSAR